MFGEMSPIHSSTNDSPMLLAPCGHALCNHCALGVQFCPVCREEVQSAVVNRPLLQMASALEKRRVASSTGSFTKGKDDFLSARVELLDTAAADAAAEATTIATEEGAVALQLQRWAALETELGAAAADIDLRQRTLVEEREQRRTETQATDSAVARLEK